MVSSAHTMNTQALATFLIDSNRAGYAGGEEKKWTKETDGSTTIPYQKGDFRSRDNFFGGEPYGGSVVVLYKEKAVWMMVYYGFVAEGISANPIYEILKGALRQMPAHAPFRGPEKYVHGDYTYTNAWEGSIERYSGEESIHQNGDLVYRANYRGGLIDQR